MSPPPLVAASPTPAAVLAAPAPAPRAEGFERRDRFLAFAFAAADLLVEADAAGRVVFAAGAFRSRFGEPPEAFAGRPVASLVAAEDRGTLAMALHLLVARGRLAPLAIRLNDRERTAFALAGLAPGGGGGAGGGRLCLTLGPLPAPVEAVKAALAASEVFAREAEARLRAAVSGEAGAEGARLLDGSLALLELGGAAGAALEARPDLAQEVGGALAADLGDALAGDLGAGRYGLLPGATGEAPDLAALAGRIEAVLLAHGVPCAVAAHAVPLRSDGLTAVQAVRALRHALGSFEREGAAGLAGRGFGGGLAGCVQKVSARASALRQAVRHRGFDLGFQPIVDLATREAHHHEALIRPHGAPGGASGGFGSPGEFVLFAETVGLTEELDLAVAEAVLAAAAASAAPLACNLSGLSVQSASFRRALVERLDAAPPGAARRLMVEVTESAEIEDERAANETLDALRARGVALCIDDFGAGAAAFRYLRSFPVDYVKVDGLYVRNAVRSERDRSFVAAMVDLSLAVGAKVIAERIETETDARVMRELGVHYGQGWLFGKPGPLPRRAPVNARRRGVADEVWA